MSALINYRKTKIRTALINFKDTLQANGQRGIFTTAIASEIREVLTDLEIDMLLRHLSSKKSN